MRWKKGLWWRAKGQMGNLGTVRFNKIDELWDI